MKKVLIAVLAGVCLVAALVAQAAPKRVLDQKTLDRFLADYPKIQAEGESSGIEIGEDSDPEETDQAAFDPAVIKAQFEKARKDPRVKAFLAKYGWDEKFWDVVLTITMSSFVVSMDQYPPEARTPELTDAVKKFKAAVHPADLDLVKANFPRITEAMDIGSGDGD